MYADAVQYFFQAQNMNSKFYKYCAVPLCKNTTIKTPQKLFIHVPTQKEIRKQWSRLAKRDKPPVAKNVYYCEDHFNMPNDMENYMQYKIMGTVKTVRMRKDCLPTRFDCQLKKKKGASKDRGKRYKSKLRKDLIESIMNENETEAESTTRKKGSKKHYITLDTLLVSGPKSTETEKRLENELQNKAQKSSEEDAEPGPSETPITPPWHIPDSSGVSDKNAEQDPLRKHTDQCRFCGEFSSDCFVVSSHMPYLAGNRTALTLNDTNIHLDFNDGLPKTVCRYCDTKLQEICDFIKTVKDAQDSMHGKIKTENEDVREIDIFIKTETESTDGDSISISDTVFVKTVSNKRKSGISKKAKVTKPDGDSTSISDTVSVKTVTNKRKSDMTKKAKVAKPNVMVECENEFVIDVKQEIIDDDDIESFRHSDADSETLSIPELKGADADFCDTAEETVVTEVIKKENVGSETTINVMSDLSPETGSENIT